MMLIINVEMIVEFATFLKASSVTGRMDFSRRRMMVIGWSSGGSRT